MVSIHPDNVRSAASHLLGRVELSLDIEHDLRRAALLSALDVTGPLTACAEIEEELGLLATLLVTRADRAEGFRLPDGDWALTSSLLGSLLDDVGFRAGLSGPLALEILVQHGRHLAIDGSNPTTTDDPRDALVFTIEDLRTLAGDPSASPELSAAAAFLVAHPHLVAATRAWEGTGAILPSHHAGEIPLRDIDAFLARNEVLRRLTGPGGIVSPTDLFSPIDDSTLEAAGVNPEHFDDLHLPRNGHDLLVVTVHHGTFDHSPGLARAFTATLPVHRVHGQNLDITQVDADAVRRLYEEATADLGTNRSDFSVRCEVIAHLPETSAGTRNQLITAAYAEIAQWHDVVLNGRSETVGQSGNNWFHLGVAASSSLHPVITGERRVLEVAGHGLFAIPDQVVQDIADGNQAIFHHFSTELARRWKGEPQSSPRMDTALDLVEQAAVETDPSERQLLVAESTVLLAIEEQIVVDPYVQLDGLGPLEHAGALLLTSLMSDPRFASQVMTDEGDLRFQIDGRDLIDPVIIGDAVPAPSTGDHLADPATLAERLPDDFDWGLAEADDWSELHQRVPIIEDVALFTLTEPALRRVVDHHRTGLLDPPE